MPETPAAEGPSDQRSRDEQARRTTIRLLQVLAAAALLLPLMLFCFASWRSHDATEALATERLERSLDVMQEQTLKVFQSMNLALAAIDDLLEGKSAAEIAADEPRLHRELRQIQAALPEVQSIWIFGPDGHPQVITRETPAPTQQDYSHEDYFMVPRDGPPGVYIGGIHPSFSGGEPYFTFNRARRGAAGKFLGVIEMSLQPNDFRRFYSHLATMPGLTYALVRDDGTVLARYPALSAETRLAAGTRFHDAIAMNAERGFFVSRGRFDGLERRFAYRKLPGLPIYLNAGIAIAQIRHEWIADMAPHLVFGIPATLVMFGAVLVVLQRTRRLHAEQDARARAEAALRQRERLDAIGRLTGGVAHDFNNLLMIIIGNLETIQRAVAGGLEGAAARLERASRNAMEGAKRAATLTQRLLAFARLHPLDPRPLDVNRMLNDFSLFLSRTLGEKVALEVVGLAGLWAVEADQAQLETALINLAVNARDAMPDGGKLTLETANVHLDAAYGRTHADVRPGDYVLISVTDSGTGMAAETLDKAFEPFFTTKPPGQGTGLGLSQVYGFVRQSGGHVAIYSEVGEGTTVKIYLPRLVGEVAVETKAESAAVTPAPAPAEAGHGERILVVEDDDDVRSYLVEALRGLNFDVAEAADAAAALAAAAGRELDLLLTDVILPGMNGRELADKLSAERPGLQVLFMTGYSRNAIVHQGRLDPGVHMLQKPVTAAELVRKMRELLGARVVA
ncbi:MAG TPA: ATP-binding protein [Xanthobacteraceae bacterium]|nr:ATP-binding protein [Xanthobacteraceae bacterium]